MYIKELSIAEFEAFSKNFTISTHHQTLEYALFMSEKGYEYNLLGLIDELGVIKAVALILIKKISLNTKYGYSPQGFLIDYFDLDLLKSFTEKIKKFYEKKLVFIKINPEIAIGEINKNTYITNYNQNIIIRDYLQELGYIKLKDNLNFESIFPRFNAIINLKEYNFKNLSKNTKNKIKKAEKKGLIFEKVERNKLDTIYNLIKAKSNITEIDFKNYYNCYEKSSNIDLFLIKIDYKTYLLNSKELYDKELLRNTEISEKLISNSNSVTINEKMNSDLNLLHYKNDIEIATSGLKNNKTTYIATAVVIKYKFRTSIIFSNFDPLYKQFNANYYLHYKIIEHYKNTHKFIDLNGISGDFTKTNKYHGLNKFKFGFNPHIYEFIGEFDLILNEKIYTQLRKKGLLAKEFNK